MFKASSNKYLQISAIPNGATTTILSDQWGNRLSIIEPNAGEIRSFYNGFNELMKQIDARGDTITYEYDPLGRVALKRYAAPNISPLAYTYLYDEFTTTNKGRGKLAQIKQTLTYPENFAVTYSYTSTGKLDEIRRNGDNSLIYKVHSRNKFNTPTRCEYGNDLATVYNYTPYWMDLSYNARGEQCRQAMRTRMCGGISADLTFCYFLVKQKVEKKNLDRLTGINFGTIGQTGTPQTFTYHDNGNILNNSHLGSYYYHNIKKHAVTQIAQNDSLVPGEIGGGIGEIIILGAQHGIAFDSMYYIHTDHLGSYCAITDANKQAVQRNWFDPWGNYQIRYDTIYSKKPIPTIIEKLSFPLTYRGFTGHEHYPQFKIINMNGRLYDPVIARFFSPDKYVANSTFTQDFNRYSYARNNPLMYVDPSGQFGMCFSLLNILEKIMEALSKIVFGKKIETLDGFNNNGNTQVSTLYYTLLPVEVTAKKPDIGPGNLRTDGFRGFSVPPPSLNIPLPFIPTQPIDNTAYYSPQALPPPPIFSPISKPNDRGDLNLPKIPVNDNLLKNLDYTATVLEGLREYSKHVNYAPLKNGSKYVPYISLPINAALTYNSFADFVNNPSLEHGYRFAKSVGSFTFLGGAISYMADTYERGTVWFAHWLTKFEKHLQSNEFWLDLYGY